MKELDRYLENNKLVNDKVIEDTVVLEIVENWWSYSWQFCIRKGEVFYINSADTDKYDDVKICNVEDFEKHPLFPLFIREVVEGISRYRNIDFIIKKNYICAISKTFDFAKKIGDSFEGGELFPCWLNLIKEVYRALGK